MAVIVLNYDPPLSLIFIKAYTTMTINVIIIIVSANTCVTANFSIFLTKQRSVNKKKANNAKYFVFTSHSKAS